MHLRKITTFAAALALGAPLVGSFTTTADATGHPVQRTVHAKKVKACKGSQLRVSFGRAGAAAGTFYRTIRFRNTKKRCAVHGWPAIGYAGKHGRAIGFLATHTHKRKHPLVLRHGAVGKVNFGTPGWYNFHPRSSCGPRHATKLAVYVPNRIRPGARHLKTLPKGSPNKVCTTRRGAPLVRGLR